MKTRRVAWDDVEALCSEAGSGERPLVLIHGFTGHRDDFVEQIPNLALQGRVLAPDLRGHGDFTHTGRPETFRFDQLAEDLAALLDVLEVGRCDLLGHSMGGMVTLRFALSRPERIHSLILMNTAPFAPLGYTREGMEKAGGIARAKGMAVLQELIEKSARAHESDRPSDRQTKKWGERYWEHHRKRYLAMDPAAYTPLGVEMLDQKSLVPRLCEIQCPTSVLVGSDDESFLPGADALETGIPQARRITIPDAGHHPHVENSEAWLDAIHQHFNRVR